MFGFVVVVRLCGIIVCLCGIIFHLCGVVVSPVWHCGCSYVALLFCLCGFGLKERENGFKGMF